MSWFNKSPEETQVVLYQWNEESRHREKAIPVTANSVIWLAGLVELYERLYRGENKRRQELQKHEGASKELAEAKTDNIVLAGKLEEALAARRELQGKLEKLTEAERVREFKDALVPFTPKPACPACTCRDTAAEPFTFETRFWGIRCGTVPYLAVTCPRCGNPIGMRRADDQ